MTTTSTDAIRTRDLGTVTLGRTTYTVTEHYYTDGRFPASTYLTGPRGAYYYLRPYNERNGDSGLRQVISMGSGAELRVHGNRVQVWHIGDVIETTRPVI